ncbi:MAG: heavy-metal-associated domain-containing protein [Bacteroidetes bacterium]|nr:heavy-metal-associated domain-containing protein [Bacteroidota bacterium]
MKKLLSIILLLMCTYAFAQNKKSTVLVIKTSAECDQCKKRIESNLMYEKGVKFCKLDVPSKNLTVTYNPEKIQPEQLKRAISKLGYDADELKADSLAYSKLPECCKNGSGNHHE